MQTTVNKKQKASAGIKPQNPADAFFVKYTESYATTALKAIHGVCAILAMFAVMGLLWAIPFPYLKFLGQYNGFFNWASFLIAIAVYGYYKISPSLSYIIFIVLFACSYGVMQLAQWQKAGGPALWLVSAITMIVFSAIQFSNIRLKNKKPSFTDGLQFLILSPVLVLHFTVGKRVSVAKS